MHAQINSSLTTDAVSPQALSLRLSMNSTVPLSGQRRFNTTLPILLAGGWITNSALFVSMEVVYPVVELVSSLAPCLSLNRLPTSHCLPGVSRSFVSAQGRGLCDQARFCFQARLHRMLWPRAVYPPSSDRQIRLPRGSSALGDGTDTSANNTDFTTASVGT